MTQTTTYQDATLRPADRADDLLARMTTREKAAQLTGVLANDLGSRQGVREDALAALLGEGIGHVGAVGVTSGDAAGIARLNNAVQHHLLDRTRLGIPAILHNETLNGVVAQGFTSFPTAIGLAAAWDPERVQEMADLIRRQMRAVGMTQGLAPVLDIARDARWGRVHETYGEDVLLSSAVGVAYVRGLQGDDLAEGVIATAKHFLGYALTEGGQNMATTHLGPRELRDVHAAPFEAAIRIAGLRSVMNSYSEIDGEPVGISRAVLTDLLRGTLGFDGTVVSDYRTLFYVVERQHALGGPEQAARLGLAAGLDVELPTAYAYGEVLAEAVDAGRIDGRLLDLSVHRVLTQKFELGLFENPYVDAEPVELRRVAAQGRELSRTLATESVTLLKNDDAVLPLRADLRALAVLGPHADSVMSGFGNYSYPPVLEMLRGLMSGRSRMAGMEAALEGMSEEQRTAARQQLDAMARIDPERTVREDYGSVSLVDALREVLPGTTVTTHAGTGVLDDEPADIEAAVAAAADADVVVLALGGRSAAFAGRATEGEGSDAATIDLPGNQRRLVEAVATLGKPVVVVLYAGKPYALAAIEPQVSAIVTGYIPGPEGGRALADVLAGRCAPGGKLPFTIPRHVGQVPIYHALKPGSGYRRYAADQFTGYVDLEHTPLYAFGHGLSYTRFGYGDVTIDSAEVAPDGVVRLRFAVRNEGDVAGTEVAQVYAGLTATGITRPAQQLAAFARVELDPGESREVEVELDVAQLGYTCEDGRFVVDPGAVELLVGSASDDVRRRAAFTVTGARTEVAEPHATLPRVTVGAPVR
jgi:beta-glucosidase